ncbi:MAG: polyprenyl synthetase family protein [Planctomycetales bacterium]|nr:polyprenyl synthetase family protein [Planctomycetales bacterium]
MSDRETGAFEQFAQDVRPEIERRLTAYTQFDAGCPERLRAAIRHSLLAPGKRLRPILVLAATRACGGDISAAWAPACAIEMVHTYSLIHDDLPAMDDDDLRRGLPTCHAAFDEATAILAGDALLTRAFEILASEIANPQHAARCCVALAHAAGASQMVGGQADDLAAEGQPGDVAKLEAIHRRKTGAMLIGSLQMGAIVADGNGEQIERLAAYGTGLGLAFQIVDDLLDFEGNAQTVGKRTGKDKDRGKLTFPALVGVDESRRRASHLIEQAIEQLAPFEDRGDILVSLAQFVLKRNR